MHTISEALRAHIANGGSTSRCITITRTDNIIIRLSDSVDPLYVNGHYYAPRPSFAGTQHQHSDASAGEALLETVFDDTIIRKNDVILGLYDRAHINICVIAPELPEEPPVIIFSGHIGNIRYDNDILKAELISLGDVRRGTIVSRYGPYCRAAFGDTACGIDAQALSFTDTAAEDGAGTLIALSAYPDDKPSFAYGSVRVDSGANQGFTTALARIEPGGIRLREALPFSYTQGDRFILTPGCDKRLTTCVSRYNNAIRFRGEPHLPGAAALR